MVNWPPIIIFPSVCTAMELTKLFALASKKLSRFPSAFSRAMLLRAAPLTVLNCPPIRIFPSASMAIELTFEFTLGVKSVSRLPSALSRAM